MSSDFLQPGTILRRTYRIVRLLGEGGAGTVYEARHVTLGHVVALKVLFPHLARNATIRARFVEEGQIQAQLRHSNLVSVVDILDGAEGQVAIVMEFVNANSLDQYIQSHAPIEQEAGIEILRGILTGLAFAHREGIIHRDIKPDNVLLEEREGKLTPKVTDFGIAKVLAADRRTRTGTKMGTVAFMAPEQIEDSSKVDVRADIYSLGVTMFEMFTGQLPFNSDNVFSLMKAHQEADVPKPSRLRPDLAPGIEAVILRAMAKDPASRYQSCDEMIEALAAIELGASPKTSTSELAQSEAPQGPSSATRDTHIHGANATQPPPVDGNTRLESERPSTEMAYRPPRPRPTAETRSGAAGPELDRTVPVAAVPRHGRPLSGANRSRSEGQSLGRAMRLCAALGLLLAGYQALPFGECLLQANRAYQAGSANAADFDPSSYTWLGVEAAQQFALETSMGNAIANGSLVCADQAGFGRGHHPMFNAMLGMSLLGLVLLLLVQRVQDSQPPLPAEPTRQPIRARPSAQRRHRQRPISIQSDTGPQAQLGALVALEGQTAVPAGSDLYLALKTRGLGQDELKDVRVEGEVEAAGGRSVSLWGGAKHLTALLTRVPSTDAFTSLPFRLKHDQVKSALVRGGLDSGAALAARIRITYSDQVLAHRAQFERD